jgi:hypothetical protein
MKKRCLKYGQRGSSRVSYSCTASVVSDYGADSEQRPIAGSDVRAFVSWLQGVGWALVEMPT